jgi:hypothetical protein
VAQKLLVLGAWIIRGGIFLLGYTSFGGVLLEWNPNSESNVAGYRVHIGNTSHVYNETVDVGIQTRYPLTNLNAGVTYFFAVSAYDVAGLESLLSDEVQYTPPVDGTNAITVPLRFEFTQRATLEFEALQGRRCNIVASTDLETWTLIHSFEASDSGINIYEDLASDEFDRRFYRVITIPSIQN